MDDEAVFLTTLCNWTLDCVDSEIQAMSVIHAISSLVNKHAEGYRSELTVHSQSDLLSQYLKSIY